MILPLESIQTENLNPILWRVIGVYLAGFVLIWILNNGRLTGLWKKNIGQRYLSWLIIGPLYLGAIFGGTITASILMLVVIGLALWELKSIILLPNRYIVVLTVLSPITLWIATFLPHYFYGLPLVYFIAFILTGITENNAKTSFQNTGTSLFIAIWLLFGLSHFILLANFSAMLSNSWELLVLLGFAIPLSDICAYVIGSAFQKFPQLDRVKVAGALSPKKSIAGGLGNIIGIILGIFVMHPITTHYTTIQTWIILAIFVGIFGLLGDISESMFKRYYKVKDSSQLIPGHGGILDRIDSSLFIVPIFYYGLLFTILL